MAAAFRSLWEAGWTPIDLHEIGRAQGNGLSQRLRYDPAGRLLEQQISRTQASAVEAVDIRRSYSYDKAGQLTGIGDSRRGNLSYRYDPLGRLLEANSRLGRETFAFDPAGNIADPASLQTQHGQPVVGRLLDNLLKAYAGTAYRYDAHGNLVERTRNGKKTAFEWDGFHRMTAARSEEGTTTFSYDPMGRRIAKRSRDAVTLFGWDGDVLAFESTQSTAGEKERNGRGSSVHYIHEPGSFVPLVQIRQARAMALSATTDVKALMDANGGHYDIEQDPLWNGAQQSAPAAFAKEAIAFYQCDHLGTPQELTDHEGRIAWSAQYKAWGEAREAISEAGRRAGFANPIRFQGQYLDEETGLHYNRYRYYDPGSGRYVSKDPLGLQGGKNAYAFVRNNPVLRADPWGLIDINMIHPDEWLHDEVEKLPSGPKTITVAGHADAYGMDDANSKEVRPSQLADKIKQLPNYDKDKTVILYACEAGRGNNCYASKLSKCLGGQRVLGAEESVWPVDGKAVIAPSCAHDQNEPDMSKRKKFRVFKS